MTSASSGHNRGESPADLLFLSAFLCPRTVEETESSIDWLPMLGVEPQKAADRFLEAELLTRASLYEHLFRKFRVVDLKQMLADRGLKVSGRKSDLIQRLIHADPEGLEQVVGELTLLECSEEERRAVEQFLSNDNEHAFHTVALPAEAVSAIIGWTLQAADQGIISDVACETLKGSLSQTFAEPPEHGPALLPYPDYLAGVTPPPIDAVDPEQPSASDYHNRAVAYGESGDGRRAKAFYSKAIERDLTFARSYYGRGLCACRLGDCQQAIADYTTAIDLDDQWAPAFHARGIAHERSGADRQAMRDYNTAIQLDPDFTSAYHDRGTVYERQGDYAQAIADYDKTIALGLESAYVYHNRGVAREKQGDYEGAMADYESAIDRDPQSSWSFYGRGICLCRMGNYRLSIADFTQAIGLNDDPARVLYARGLAYERLGKFERATTDYEKGLGYSRRPDQIKKLQKRLSIVRSKR